MSEKFKSIWTIVQTSIGELEIGELENGEYNEEGAGGDDETFEEVEEVEEVLAVVNLHPEEEDWEAGGDAKPESPPPPHFLSSGCRLTIAKTSSTSSNVSFSLSAPSSMFNSPIDVWAMVQILLNFSHQTYI